MRKEEKERIIQWIFDNHNHHHGVPGYDLIGKKNIPDTTKCENGYYSYVNSVELEEFIKSFDEDLGIK